MGRRTESRTNLAREFSFGEIHRVGDSNDDETGMRDMWPIEKVVDDILSFRQHLIEFIDQHDSVIPNISICRRMEERERTSSCAMDRESGSGFRGD